MSVPNLVLRYDLSNHAILTQIIDTNQAAAAFIALASDVGGGTLTNGKLHIANGSALPSIVFGTLGLWSSYPATPDRIYFAALSTTAPVVYAHSMFNS